MEGTARHLRPRRTSQRKKIKGRERSVTKIKACQTMIKG